MLPMMMRHFGRVLYAMGMYMAMIRSAQHMKFSRADAVIKMLQPGSIK